MSEPKPDSLPTPESPSSGITVTVSRPDLLYRKMVYHWEHNNDYAITIENDALAGEDSRYGPDPLILNLQTHIMLNRASTEQAMYFFTTLLILMYKDRKEKEGIGDYYYNYNPQRVEDMKKRLEVLGYRVELNQQDIKGSTDKNYSLLFGKDPEHTYSLTLNSAESTPHFTLESSERKLALDQSQTPVLRFDGEEEFTKAINAFATTYQNIINTLYEEAVLKPSFKKLVLGISTYSKSPEELLGEV